MPSTSSFADRQAGKQAGRQAAGGERRTRNVLLFTPPFSTQAVLPYAVTLIGKSPQLALATKFNTVGSVLPSVKYDTSPDPGFTTNK